jgi:CDP-paratose 2-epimerase
MKILVTGAAGLVGSEVSKFFAEKGYRVTAIDNYMRGRFFGKDGDTSGVMMKLLREYDIKHYELDIRDKETIELVKKVDVVIHAAAQPSHPKSIEIPIEDFQINAWGTLQLLEALRLYNNDAIFIFCSTNKVYGDAPNCFKYRISGKRFEPIDPRFYDGFDESLRIDNVLHTPFGVSKTAADLYVQEYAKLYGLRTGIFRMGCITGGAAMAVEQHNWEPYFVRKALLHEKLTIFGYGGYQVRDVIHARDLATLFYEFLQEPHAGEVYNVGGGKANSISLLEAIDLIEQITGNKISHDNGSAREGDHMWWITSLRKVKSHFQNWNLTMDINRIFREIYEIQRDLLKGETK